MSSFRCYVIGGDSLLIECSEQLLRKGHTLAGVITSTDRIASWAKQRGVPVVPADDHVAAQIAGDTFDYLFAITHLALLPPEVLALPRRMTINFHDGPLPRYAGLNTPAWALIEQQEEYGITWHQVVPTVDAGPILKQRRFPLSAGETSISLNTRCFEAGIETFAELIDELAENRAVLLPQDLSQRSYYPRAKRPAAACVLDVQQPAETLAAMVRALDFGPYENPLGAAKLVHGGDAVIVKRATARDDARYGAPGTVLAVHEHEVLIATSRQVLAIQEVATLDGQTLGLSEWLHRWSLTDGDLLHGLTAEVAERLTNVNQRLAVSESFWVRRLTRRIPLELPYVQATPDSLEHPEWQTLAVPIDPNLGKAQGGDPVDHLLTAVVSYLARLSGQFTFDLAYSTATPGDDDKSLSHLIAPEAMWRVKVDANDSFAVINERLRDSRERLAKRGTWLRDLVARYPAIRETSNLHQGKLLPVAIHLDADPDTMPQMGTVLAVYLSSRHPRCQIVYDAAAIEPQSAEKLATQLAWVVKQLGTPEVATLGQISLLTIDERQRILNDWNANEIASTPPTCIHTQFAAQVLATPDRTAVTFEGQSLTYAELESRADWLASQLRSRDVGPDVRVGIHLQRSLDLVAAVLGVLKAGGAYVPLDPGFPADRLNFMATDAGIRVLLTQSTHASSLQVPDAEIVFVDRAELGSANESNATAGRDEVRPEHLAYVIYTSGSTGLPKGVMVEHRNVTRFFAGMDDRVPHEPPGTWLAVTTLSFDISVLELLWTLCRGFHVVLYLDRQRGATPSTSAPLPTFLPRHADRSMEFSLYYWGNDDATTPNKYELLIEGARFADANGFSAVWTPERHFHAFGGPYPNPAVTGAAVAAITRNVQIRAGSCVLPLHHPIRVAEEWAVVDNLSNGRAAVAFASGWQPHDFVLRPENYGEHKSRLFEDLKVVQQLWRGESVEFPGPGGESVPRVTQPRPIQRELPIWITTAGNPDTYRQAGASGANLLTHLLGQSVDELAEKIRLYRAAREAAGYDPRTGKVTLMLHTLVGDSDAQVRDIVRGPMKDYLGSSVSLVKQFSWAFPAFKRPKGEAEPVDVDLASLTGDELDAILEFAFQRYFETSGLFGSVESCLRVVDRLKGIGVDDIACLIDFGVPCATVLSHLPKLAEVLARSNAGVSSAVVSENTYSPQDESVAALIQRHQVTHLQCTPSMARMLLADDATHAAFRQLDYLFIGGEAFPPVVAQQLRQLVRGTVLNMYGPTEATVWASTYKIAGGETQVPIGRPIPYARLYVLDDQQQPAPPGVAGELYIGGELVVRGYHGRPELTAERFVPDPFAIDPAARMYRTGDLARWRSDGQLEFLGRNDYQVKIRGYRIELGEIEASLAQHPQIDQVVVVAREDIPGDQRLVAYAVAKRNEPAAGELRDHLRRDLPEYMVPAHFVFLDKLPMTPNGKIDRKKLPALDAAPLRSAAPYVPPADDLQATIAQLWCKSLGLDKVGIDDNFFDVGGHSLLVVRLHRELTHHLVQPVTLTDLYRFPTIRTLVEHLKSSPDTDTLQDSDDRASQRREAMTRRRQRSRQD